MQGFLMGEGLEGPPLGKNSTNQPFDTIPIFEHELVPPRRGLLKKIKKKKKRNKENIIHQF